MPSDANVTPVAAVAGVPNRAFRRSALPSTVRVTALPAPSANDSVSEAGAVSAAP
jgi:hypothetical protein